MNKQENQTAAWQLEMLKQLFVLGFFLLKYHFCQEDKCQLYSENVQCQDALKWEYIISTKFLND